MESIFAIEAFAWLTVASFFLIWASPPVVWQVFYGVAVLVGLLTGALQATALIPTCLLLFSIYVYKTNPQFSLFALLTILVTGVVLGMHVLPGFSNQEYLSSYQLNAESAPFSIWFNYDKSMFGLLVLGLILSPTLIRSRLELAEFAGKLYPVLFIGLPMVFLTGLILGYARFDWTPSMVFFPWALKNLFFTVAAEEVLFRGLIQREIDHRIKSQYFGVIAIAVASALFGLAHFAGGIEYVVLSTLAGVVYGVAYKVTGRIEGAFLAHFLLNASHFLLFSYPYSV